MSVGPSMRSLSSEAHIWLTGPAETVADYLPLLAQEEVEQFERYRVEHARRLYLAGRALTRSVLSLYHPNVDPTAWRFRFNRHGRPEIEGPADWPPLRFNISHTDGLVACLVTLEHDGGVDVEEIERRIDLAGVAAHSFSESEANEVRLRSGRQRRVRFFHYWTLKEAYIKARGMGLALPLRRFTYTFPEPGEVAITFDPEIEDREHEWQIALWEASSRHYLATAIRRGDGPDLNITVRRSTPLAQEVEVVSLPTLVRSKPATEVGG